MKIFEDDDPLVTNGTYDVEGYKPGERARLAKAAARQRAAQQRCDHTFIDSTHCLKCGWRPDAV
jgi:hypothetical protein